MCREQYRTYTGMQVDVRMFRVNGFDRSNNFNNSIFNHVWSFFKTVRMVIAVRPQSGKGGEGKEL